MCHWTGYGFCPLCPKQGIQSCKSVLNSVLKRAIKSTVLPKQGIYFRNFLVLNRVRVSNPQRLTFRYQNINRVPRLPPPTGYMSCTEVHCTYQQTPSRMLKVKKSNFVQDYTSCTTVRMTRTVLFNIFSIPRKRSRTSRAAPCQTPPSHRSKILNNQFQCH